MDNNDKENIIDEKKILYEFSKKINQADKLAKEYERDISQGNLEKLVPYSELIFIYEDIINELTNMKNNEGSTISSEIIQDYIKKKEKISNRIHDLRFEKKINSMVNKATILAYNYEISLKKKKFEHECPYLEIIDIYKSIINKMLEKGWISQLEYYSKEIEIYKKRLEKDRKLREIENQKTTKNKEFEQSYKIKELDSVEAVLESLDTEMRILTFEEKKQEKNKKFEIILNKIDKAEKLAKDYKKNIINGKIFQFDCPYEKIIEIYESAKDELNKIGWKDASIKMLDSISFYKNQLEKDKELREYEKKKLS